jgi:hypothetical protein
MSALEYTLSTMKFYPGSWVGNDFALILIFDDTMHKHTGSKRIFVASNLFY